MTRGWDVLSEFTELFPDSLVESINSLELAYTKTTGNPKPDRFEPILADRSGTREGSEGAVTDSPNNLDKIPKSLEYLKKDFTEQQMQIILSLAKRPMHLDQIIEECNLTAAQALAELTILEIKGAVTQLPGKRFSANSTI